MKRGDHRRRRTVGRIERGDGNGGDPVWAHHVGPYVRQFVAIVSARALSMNFTRRQPLAEIACRNEA
ncbi:hypothetical protein [Roseobacter sp. CCS2]|uniref:hypothetical protein n=1 Tax=Roseobacter sp. CCS2 TaxID=391593 RepID=UPI0012EA789B|nr:hypothetical protein [Roseobacter sp. CCS2]